MPPIDGGLAERQLEGRCLGGAHRRARLVQVAGDVGGEERQAHRSGGCVLPLISRRAASAAVGGGRDVEGDAASPASDHAAAAAEHGGNRPRTFRPKPSSRQSDTSHLSTMPLTLPKAERVIQYLLHFSDPLVIKTCR